MSELIQHLLDEPIANVIVLAGIAFLFIAAVGKIQGKIDLDSRGRVMCAFLGLALVPGGLFIHHFQDFGGPQTQARATSTATPVQIPPSTAGTDLSTVKPAAASGDICKTGYVWRGSRPSDHVCVTPEMRTRTAEDNKLALSRRQNGGPYGVDTCLAGFVWREAVPGDHVCVTPEMRTLVRNDNSAAMQRIAP